MGRLRNFYQFSLNFDGHKKIWVYENSLKQFYDFNFVDKMGMGYDYKFDKRKTYLMLKDCKNEIRKYN